MPLSSYSPACLGSQVIIDVDLLGFVYHWGLDVNSITVIRKLRNTSVAVRQKRG